MQKIIHVKCPKCNNNQHFHKFGKDKFGNQKYRCLDCGYQFAPDFQPKTRMRKYPPCPVCGKSSFYTTIIVIILTIVAVIKSVITHFLLPNQQLHYLLLFQLCLEKLTLKRMRHSPFLIITVLYQFFIGKSSTRNISLMLHQLYNIKLSHVTIADWCKKFAPILNSISLKLTPMMDFNSDEWHADETVVKINGKKHYIWFIIDSETRFVLGFHLSPYRDSSQAHSLFSYVAPMGNPQSIVSDR